MDPATALLIAFCRSFKFLSSHANGSSTVGIRLFCGRQARWLHGSCFCLEKDLSALESCRCKSRRRTNRDWHWCRPGLRRTLDLLTCPCDSRKWFGVSLFPGFVPRSDCRVVMAFASVLR